MLGRRNACWSETLIKNINYEILIVITIMIHVNTMNNTVIIILVATMSMRGPKIQ